MGKQYRNKYMYIYADVFFTKGYNRTLICEPAVNSSWHFIPNEFYETILLFRNKLIDDIIDENPYNIDVEGLIEYLLKNNYGSLVDDISLFPPIEMKWYSPHVIENAIIDIDKQSQHDYDKIANELDALLCKNVQIRSYISIDIFQIEDIIRHFMGHNFESIDFILKFTDNVSHDAYLSLAKEYPSVSFIVHSSPQNQFYESLLHGIYPIVGYVQYTKQIISSSDCCGIINKDNLVHPTCIHDYVEGVLRNKCLNKKISIDADGNIKNCPSMKQCYGNIKSTSLVDVCALRKFRSYWFITKDKIKVCKDCEYRYVCNDCRAFVKHKFDKPKKCNYDPYKS